MWQGLLGLCNSHSSMLTPVICNCALWKFKKKSWYFAKHCHWNTAWLYGKNRQYCGIAEICQWPVEELQPKTLRGPRSIFSMWRNTDDHTTCMQTDRRSKKMFSHFILFQVGSRRTRISPYVLHTDEWKKLQIVLCRNSRSIGFSLQKDKTKTVTGAQRVLRCQSRKVCKSHVIVKAPLSFGIPVLRPPPRTRATVTAACYNEGGPSGQPFNRRRVPRPRHS